MHLFLSLFLLPQQNYYHSYLPTAYETKRFGEYEVTVDSVQTLGDIAISEMRMATIKVKHWTFYNQLFFNLAWQNFGSVLWKRILKDCDNVINISSKT